MFLTKDKNAYPFAYILSLGSIEYLIFIQRKCIQWNRIKWIFYLITKVKFILSSISNGWLFWSVYHTSMSWNSELNVFKKIWFVGEISNKLPNGLFGTNVYKTLESCW